MGSSSAFRSVEAVTSGWAGGLSGDRSPAASITMRTPHHEFDADMLTVYRRLSVNAKIRAQLEAAIQSFHEYLREQRRLQVEFEMKWGIGTHIELR